MGRWRSAVAVAFALLVAACGGGDDASAIEGETVRSADGVLTVEVPPGAAADDVAVEIALIAEDDIPAALQSADSVVIGYELSPDGSEFSEPLVITFRLDPTDLGVELDDGAVPFGLLLTQDAAGEFEGIEDAVFSREDGLVVARGEVAHFTPAFLVLSEMFAVALIPDAVDLTVGETTQVEIALGFKTILGGSGVASQVGKQLKDFDLSRIEWSAKDPFSAAKGAVASEDTGSVTCHSPTAGVVLDAYKVTIAPELGVAGAVAIIFDQLEDLGMAHLRQQIELAGDGTCTGGSVTSTSTSTSTSTTQPASDESDDLIGVGGDGEVRDTAWHYAQGLEGATASLESITDCAELDPLWESFSGLIGVDQNDSAAVELALALDEVAYELRQRLGC